MGLDSEQSSIVISEAEVPQIEAFSGPTWFLYVSAGGEESAHALLKASKRQKGVSDSPDTTVHENTTAHLEALNSTAQLFSISKPVETVNSADIDALLKYTNDDIPAFADDTDDIYAAGQLVSKFVEGARFPIKEVTPHSKASEINLGLIHYKDGDPHPIACYIPKYNTIYINRNALQEHVSNGINKELKIMNPEESMVRYLSDEAEKRALLWKIQLDKEYGMTRQLENDRRLYAKVSKQNT